MSNENEDIQDTLSGILGGGENEDSDLLGGLTESLGGLIGGGQKDTGDNKTDSTPIVGDIETELTNPVGEAQKVEDASAGKLLKSTGIGDLGVGLKDSVAGIEKDLADEVGLGDAFDSLDKMADDLDVDSMVSDKDDEEEGPHGPG